MVVDLLEAEEATAAPGLGYNRKIPSAPRPGHWSRNTQEKTLKRPPVKTKVFTTQDSDNPPRTTAPNTPLPKIEKERKSGDSAAAGRPDSANNKNFVERRTTEKPREFEEEEPAPDVDSSSVH